MGRISALTELTTLASDDYLVVLDSSANIAKKISVANAFGIQDFGWTASGESWTFSSYSSSTKIGIITVPSDATTKYTVGMKVKFTQSTGGTKYGFVVAVTSTTLSVFFGLTTTLVNEAITSPNYSIGYMPLGYNGPVLTKEAYQSNTTNSERWVYEVSGWGVVAYPAAANVTETVTLPLTFAGLPIPIITFGGDNPSSSVYGDGGNLVEGIVIAKAHTVTTSSFIAQFHKGSGANFVSGNAFYQWQAKGPVT